MSPAHLETIFCDDVRSEIGHKLSFMGVYGGDLLVDALPATIPRICAVMSLYLPADTAAETVTFRLWRDSEEIGRTTASVAAARKTAPPIVGPHKEQRLCVRFVAQVAPLEFAAPGLLRTGADVDGKAISGASLVVAVATPSDAG